MKKYLSKMYFKIFIFALLIIIECYSFQPDAVVGVRNLTPIHPLKLLRLRNKKKISKYRVINITSIDPTASLTLPSSIMPTDLEQSLKKNVSKINNTYFLLLNWIIGITAIIILIILALFCYAIGIIL